MHFEKERKFMWPTNFESSYLSCPHNCTIRLPAGAMNLVSELSGNLCRIWTIDQCFDDASHPTRSVLSVKFKKHSYGKHKDVHRRMRPHQRHAEQLPTYQWFMSRAAACENNERRGGNRRQMSRNAPPIIMAGISSELNVRQMRDVTAALEIFTHSVILLKFKNLSQL